MSLDYERVRYKNKHYAVLHIKYKDGYIPSIIDWDDLKWVKNLKKRWHCSTTGSVYCYHTFKGDTKEVYLHEIIMALRNENGKRQKTPILHLNKIGLDNRSDNLIYDLPDKDINRNFKKKKRTVVLPKEAGIDPDDIPTYVWYMRPDATHGERFMIDIGDVNWKTTSSREYSLKYKLDEAKAFLKKLKQERPDLFENYSMNGDFTKEGKSLLNSFYSIIHRGGYDHIKRYNPTNNTDKLLKIKTIDLILSSEKRRRPKNNIPDYLNIRSNDLPEYCYYKPADEDRGDFFYVINSKLIDNGYEKNVWRTTSKKYISTEEKYQQLLDFLDENDLL